MADNLNITMGVSGLLNIFIVLICMGAAWWVLQEFRFDIFLRNPKSPAGKMLQIFLSIALGYMVARFLIDYLQWAMMLRWIF